MTSDYSIDLTQQTGNPANWTIADQTVLKYDSDGAHFTFNKRFDAPYMWTSFYFLYGRIEVVAKAANGTGIVTGAVLMSDCMDEVDWEWSGSNFGSSSGKVQTNVFGKGMTGNYDRGTQPDVDDPINKFHTYTLDWTPSKLTWSIDGKMVRTLNNNGDKTGNYQYPNTPSTIHLGVWNAGDQDSAQGVVNWVGGHTDVSKTPYSAVFKSVKITNMTPCSSWEYAEKSTDCKCTNQTIAQPPPGSDASTAAPKPTNLPCIYTVALNDYGYGIASKLQVSFADLDGANPGIDWDKLLAGQSLKVPGGNCSNPTAPSNSTVPTQTPLYSNTTTTPTPTSAATSCLYTVAAGENGNGIAQRLHVSFDDLNSVNDVDWDHLGVGQPLKIPGSKCFPMGSTTSTVTPPYANATTSVPPYGNSTTPASTAQPSTTAPAGQYIVCKGDYGYQIAAKLNCTFDDLTKANPNCDWDHLLIGQPLNVCNNTPANNTNVVTSGQPSTAPTTTGSAMSTMTVKPSGNATDLNQICAIKTTTVCPSSPVAAMNRTTSTAIYTNGSIAIVPNYSRYTEVMRVCDCQG